MDSKLAIFSNCTNNFYFAYCATSLLTFRKYYTKSKLFLCGNFDDDIIKLIKSLGIEPIKIDYKDIFKMKEKSKYPSECFWWLGIPEILHKKGFEKAMYIDGDILCKKKLPDQILRNVHSISGNGNVLISKMVEYSDISRMKKNNSNKSIINLLKIDVDKIIEERKKNDYGNIRLQTSVLLFDLKWYVDYKLFDKSKKLFNKILKKGEFWNGDDSFLALLALVYPDLPLNVIPNLHNHPVYNSDPYIFHFHSQKPWKNNTSTNSIEWKSFIHKKIQKYF